jgi:predicted MFS family arabinose efflux permease
MSELLDLAPPANVSDHFRAPLDPAVRRRERLVLLALAAVQFITIVDFMVVMPLGPQLMRTLGISPAQFGLIVSSYTMAAGVAGVVASTVVDRFSRRASFIALYVGFLVGTLCCALAPTYHLLVVSRIVTGAFGGLLGGLSLAIIGDVFPERRRGRATSSLMTGFAVASVVGVPLGIWLGANYGWHIPFICLVVVGAPVAPLAGRALPPLDDHLGKAHPSPWQSLAATFSEPNHLRAFALIATLMIGAFTVVPYIASYLVLNVGISEAQVSLVYVVGGALTLFAAPVIGALADRFGKLVMYRIIAPLSALLMLIITHLPRVGVTVAVVTVGLLMVVNAGRMIAAMAMVTSSVRPAQRGGFMSANSSVQHLATGLGAWIGGLIIQQATETSPLTHFGVVGWLAAAATLGSLWFAGRVRIAENHPSGAQPLSLAAAAEATADVGEPLAPT